jgi:hypothetical protein
MRKILFAIFVWTFLFILWWCSTSESDTWLAKRDSPNFVINYPEWRFIYPYKDLIGSLNKYPDFAKSYKEYSDKFWRDKSKVTSILFRDPLNELWWISVRIATQEDSLNMESMSMSELKELLETVWQGLIQNIGEDVTILEKDIYKGENNIWIVVKTISSNPFDKQSVIINITSISFKDEKIFSVWFTSSDNTGKEFMENNYKKILDSFYCK